MEQRNQLQCFRAVAERESISEAARVLYVSQPSLSQTIRRLEKEIGFPLFDRKGKRIFLNGNGRILLDAVNQMTEIYTGAMRQLEEQNHCSHPQVSVFMGCASMHLPNLLLFLRRKHPEIEFRFFQWREALADEQDIGIVALEGRITQYFQTEEWVQDGVCYEPLFEEEMVLALPASHDLVKAKEIHVEDLLGEEFICLNEAWMLGKMVQRKLREMGLSLKTAVLVDNPSLMRELLRKGLGMAFVPKWSWEEFAPDTVAMRTVEDWNLWRTACICYRKKRYLTKEENACIRGIREYFAQFMA